MSGHTEFVVQTRGRGAVEITARVEEVVRESGVGEGVAVVFLRHTSASLLVTENADAAVLEDLERWLGELAPDGDPRWRHCSEGPDDMAAHLRTVALGVSVTVPVVGGRLGLGTWQGVFLYEHRTTGHRRSVVVTVLG